MSAPLAPWLPPVKNPLLTGCMRFLFDQIKMHNHNVVKDEIKPWNDFPLRFLVTQSDPSARSPSKLGSRFQPRPEAEEDLARSTPPPGFPHPLQCLIHHVFISENTTYMRPKTMAEVKLVNHSESHLPLVKFYSFCRSPWKNHKRITSGSGFIYKIWSAGSKLSTTELSVFITVWAESCGYKIILKVRRYWQLFTHRSY